MTTANLPAFLRAKKDPEGLARSLPADLLDHALADGMDPLALQDIRRFEELRAIMAAISRATDAEMVRCTHRTGEQDQPDSILLCEYRPTPALAGIKEAYSVVWDLLRDALLECRTYDERTPLKVRQMLLHARINHAGLGREWCDEAKQVAGVTFGRYEVMALATGMPEVAHPDAKWRRALKAMRAMDEAKDRPEVSAAA